MNVFYENNKNKKSIINLKNCKKKKASGMDYNEFSDFQFHAKLCIFNRKLTFHFIHCNIFKKIYIFKE